MAHSLLRNLQYKSCAETTLGGKVIDLGGSRKNGYHELFKGENQWTVVNFGSLHPGADLEFDIEKPFPLGDQSFDHIVILNVLEHIFEYRNVITESKRILKSGGTIVIATPFMHHIHGSPDDFHRYTDSAYAKIAQSHDLSVICIKPLGGGLASLCFQSLRAHIPTDFLKNFCGVIARETDHVLALLPRYSRIIASTPLGFFVVYQKK
jgi:SAM-dependent methyltransferase